MNAHEILQATVSVLDAVSQGLGALVVASTILVRLTKRASARAAVLGFGSKFWKVIAWLPTIGVNPQTKALKEAYAEAQSQLEAKAPL